MGRTHIHRISVEFGDCDPAGIVFYPNFFRWFDASARHFFVACGVPPWRETEKASGIIGTPLVSVSSDFRLPASYGDVIEVHTAIEEWRGKAFVMKHVIRCGDRLLCEGREVRVFAIRHPDDPARIKAVPVPPEIRRLCESG
jgi:4-hydroxybenzoyl-CoA thioesterase